MSAWQEVGDRVFRHRYQFLDFNVGVVVGAEGTLVVDTRASHVQGQELLLDLRRLTTLPVRWIVNTHFHWDHCWGNAIFRESEIWGHSCCRLELVQNGESARTEVLGRMPAEMREELEAVEIVPPDKVFERSAAIDLGGRTVHLRYLGRGHTNSDIIVEVAEAAVVFAGDLIEEGSPPAFRDAYPLDWCKTVSALLDRITGVAVPGHGDTVDRAYVQSQLRELEAVAELARRCYSGEISLEDAASAGPFPLSTMEPALQRALRQLGEAGAT